MRKRASANKDRKRAAAIVARLLTIKRQPFGCLFALDYSGRLLLLLSRLDRGQCDGIDDIVYQRATGQVVDRLAHTLQHRPDGDQVGRALYRFVRGVTGVQIRKMNTVARPATGEFGALDFATSAITAASYCSGPSIIRSGRFSCARRSLRGLSRHRYPRRRYRWSRRASPRAVRCRRQSRIQRTE